MEDGKIIHGVRNEVYASMASQAVKAVGADLLLRRLTARAAAVATKGAKRVRCSSGVKLVLGSNAECARIIHGVRHVVCASMASRQGGWR